jgi:pimeloyl-ACP methyl ester carboxylesterase
VQQIKAVQSWMATNWTGVCEELTKISNPTLVITGTDDVIVPTANSLIIAAKGPPESGLYRSKMLVINHQDRNNIP